MWHATLKDFNCAALGRERFCSCFVLISKAKNRNHGVYLTGNISTFLYNEFVDMALGSIFSINLRWTNGKTSIPPQIHWWSTKLHSNVTVLSQVSTSEMWVHICPHISLNMWWDAFLLWNICSAFGNLIENSSGWWWNQNLNELKDTSEPTNRQTIRNPWIIVQTGSWVQNKVDKLTNKTNKINNI